MSGGLGCGWLLYAILVWAFILRPIWRAAERDADLRYPGCNPKTRREEEQNGC